MFTGGTVPLGLVGVTENAEAEEVEPSGADAHKREGALPLVGAALALVERTASVDLASKAEQAMAAKPEA